MQFSIALLALVAAVSAAPATDITQAVGDLCQITGITIAGNPARPANIDGVCLNANTCNAEAGTAFGNCAGGGQCCFKFDCAGRNSNSACLNPQLIGDVPPSPGRFVNGACPQGLRCFQLI